MGEVAHPGTFDISGDRITLLEALSMAGDLTIYGRRDRVAVIREKDGKRRILYHDLRSSDNFSVALLLFTTERYCLCRTE